jgi:hypothetical protein
MNRWQKRASKKKKSVSFTPSRSDVQAAVDEYLKSGGKITKLEASDLDYEEFMRQKEAYSSINDFFLGN